MSESQGAVENPVYSLTIWGNNWHTVEAVSHRIHFLFHKKKLQTGTGRWVYSKRTSGNDQMQEQTNFAGIALHFRFGTETFGEMYG